jgi:uncharacterized protein
MERVLQSCIYEGQVRHSRHTPVRHRFRYRVFLMYLDLDELPTIFARRWFWSARRPAIARFRRENYLGPADRPLGECVRDLVAAKTGRRPQGPIRLLTNLSYFGYCFNPVSYYYCFDRDDRRIETIVAEVTNTPWGERASYVLSAREAQKHGKSLRYRASKALHVSPFMPMDMQYEWCFTEPEQRLTIHMANVHKGKRVFDAAVVLDRIEIGAMSLAQTLLRFPVMTVKIVAAIHWQALRLWLKGCPTYEHPEKRQKIAVSSR